MFRFRSLLALLLGPLLAVAASAQNDFVNWESPHVSPVALTRDAARLLAVNTADNRLEVFDLESGVPVHERSIAVGLDPVSVRARTGTEAWVVNHLSDSVSIVDLERGNVVATLATDDEPCDVAFAGSPARAFVSCSQANTVLVFDPSDLGAAPARIPIRGEDPRAMAVSADGGRVFVLVFESGNRTTVLGGGIVNQGTLAFPPNVVSRLGGPWGGVNPPPNSGAGFEPAMTAGLPAPPPVSLIVRRDEAEQWMDDNGGNWTALVSGPQAESSGRPTGWTLLDHDVAILDAQTLGVSYADGLMNMNMALAVHPATGEVSVVGTEATNEVRFEPNLSGTFVRSHMATFAPDDVEAVALQDLNSHLDYSVGTLPQSERDLALGDPRGIVWNASGKRAYVTGMGSNNVLVLDSEFERVGTPIEVGEGPTGLVLDEGRRQLYVLNKFDASISVVSTGSASEGARIPFFDPSPSAVKLGRKHLYDTHATSGTGVVSCGSCHVDARMDRLAWDLGNPAGGMKVIDSTQNLGAGFPGLTFGFEDWHPMKGPMLTQTLQDIVGKEPHHWRGDKDGLEEFNPAFEGLLGDDEQRTSAEMQEFEDFIATIFYPPNPFRNFDNTLPTDLALPGHFRTGRFGSAGEPLPNGNAVRGLALFRPPSLLDANALACVTCHTRPTGAGTDHRRQGGRYRPFPVGASGEHHLALVAVDGTTNVTMKIPQLRNLYERTGFNATQLESTAGFGYVHDGAVDSIERFVSEPAFTVQNDQQVADLTAFMLAYGGVKQSLGSVNALLEPPGPPSQSSHAAVGKQLTLASAPDAAQGAMLDAMLALTDDDAVGVVVKGLLAAQPRGWVYVGAGVFQSDRAVETFTRAALEVLAAPGSELTFTVVPSGSERRIGVDRDADGWMDRDELDMGSDPADPDVQPRRALPRRLGPVRPKAF